MNDTKMPFLIVEHRSTRAGQKCPALSLKNHLELINIVSNNLKPLSKWQKRKMKRRLQMSRTSE